MTADRITIEQSRHRYRNVILLYQFCSWWKTYECTYHAFLWYASAQILKSTIPFSSYEGICFCLCFCFCFSWKRGKILKSIINQSINSNEGPFTCQFSIVHGQFELNRKCAEEFNDLNTHDMKISTLTSTSN